jgi:cellobiose phosphorylase
VWYALACRAIAPHAGAREAEFLSRAEKVMEDILPYRAAFERDKARVYRLEPYALAGDVHTSPSLFGRCGWNHYTGSAAWAWRYFAESDDPRPV